MDYLKKYNLSEEDINEIINSIDEMDRLEYDVQEENIERILDYLVKKNINIKELLKKKSYLFYTNASVIIEKLNNIDEKELLKINENVDLIDDMIWCINKETQFIIYNGEWNDSK